MTASTVDTTNLVTEFDNEVVREYVRGGRFGPHTGRSSEAIFQITEGLKIASIPLISKLSGAGVKASTALVGAEEALANTAYTLTPTYHRHGVLVTNEENEKSDFELRVEARPALMNWGMELKRDHMIQALGAMMGDSSVYAQLGGTDGATGAGEATDAIGDAWNQGNPDRVIYGDNLGNRVDDDHSASLLAVASTETMTLDLITLMKRRAEVADPLIRPVMLNGDEPFYVVYMGAFSFRDLEADLQTLQSNAMPRSVEGNPLWSAGDLYLNGLIVKKIPEIDHFIDGTTGTFGGEWGAGAGANGLDTAGASSARLAPAFLCGAQAVGFGMGVEPKIVRKNETDYGHQAGVGITMKHDIRKTFFNGKQHGVLTSFHAAALDA